MEDEWPKAAPHSSLFCIATLLLAAVFALVRQGLLRFKRPDFVRKVLVRVVLQRLLDEFFQKALSYVKIYKKYNT